MRSKVHTSGGSNARAAVGQQTDGVNGIDRAFFLWLLSSLVTATVISGVIALWAIVGPPLG